MWKIILLLMVIAYTLQARTIGEYMRGGPPSRVLQLTASCSQSCMSSGRGWTYSFMLSETVRGGMNRYYEYPNQQKRLALDILGIENILSSVSLSSFASLKAKELLKNPALASTFAGLVPSLQSQVNQVMSKFALSSQDKLIVRFRLQGSDGKWIVYPIVFYGDGGKATSIGLQPEDLRLKRMVVYYFPQVNTVDLYVNDVIGSWPPPPDYGNICPEGISNCYGKYTVQVWDENGNLSYMQDYSHNGAYDNNPEGFIRSVVIPMIPRIDEDIENVDVFFFRAGQYYYNEDKGYWNVALDYQSRLLRFMNIYVWNWECVRWTTCYYCCGWSCNEKGCSCSATCSYPCCARYECLSRLALRRFYRYDNTINYTYSIRQMAEIYNVRQKSTGDWDIYLAGIEDMREYDANFLLEKRVSTCGLTPDYVSQRVINPGHGRSDLLEISWFNSLGEDNPIRSLAGATVVNDRIDINCCYGPCEDPRRYDPCPGYP